MMATAMADVLRAAGLRVVEVEGWRTRTRPGGLKGVKGIDIHYTATSNNAKGNMPTLNILKTGYAGLAGPLSQLGLGRDGTWYVVAAGRCNHAGKSDKIENSNSYALGVEAEHSGSGPWPKAQYDSYVKGVAALANHYNVQTKFIRGHKEFALPYGRKADPNFDMNQFRREVDAARSPKAKLVAPLKAVVTKGVGRVKGDRPVVNGNMDLATVQAWADYIKAPRPLGAPDWGKDRMFVRRAQTWSSRQRTGIWTRSNTRTVQAKVGAKVDGIWGKNTTAGLQRFLQRRFDENPF